MQFERFFFLVQCTIFYYQFHLISSMIGPNIRAARDNEFPYVLSIIRIQNRNRSQIEFFHRCTGTLVSKQNVLTADHCLRTTFEEGFKLLIGSRDLRQATAYFPLFIWTYEDWAKYRERSTNNKYHDITFVKLTKNVPGDIHLLLTGYVTNRVLYRKNVVTAGWGKVDNNTIPRFMQTTELKVLSRRECDDRIFLYDGSELGVDDRYVCSVGDPYAVLNRGDSGGPLLFLGAIVAINTAVCPNNDGIIRPQQINLHMSIHYYRDYLEDIETNFDINF